MENLGKGEMALAEQFLNRQFERFEQVKGVTPLIEHEIRLEDPTPIKQRYRSKLLMKKWRKCSAKEWSGRQKAHGAHGW